MKPGSSMKVLVSLAVVALLAGCGRESRDAAEDIDESAAAETVLDSVTQAPELAQQQLDAAREGHEQALEAQLEASEGGRAGSSASARD